MEKELSSGSVGGVSPIAKGRKAPVTINIDLLILEEARVEERGFISWAAEKGIRTMLKIRREAKKNALGGL